LRWQRFSAQRTAWCAAIINNSFTTKDRKMPQGIEDFLEDILVLGIILKGI